ncbi:MAG: glycosyltransferase family 39 protein [Aureibaculum sp.]
MKNNFYFKIFLVICAFALFINVGQYGVIESSDARYAEIAREMFISGDFIHPNLLDVHHYHKPPFTYQITAIGYYLFGVNPFGARFFLQIAVLIQLMLMYSLTKMLFKSEKTALWSSIIYFSFPIVLISSRNLTTDAFVATFVLLSIYAWVKYRKFGLIKWLYFFTISLAVGFLTKGPVVFIVPVIFVLFYNRIEKAKYSLSIHHLLAWFLCILISSSWFIYLAIENPIFIDYFLGRQTVDRFSVNAFGRTEPFWYFLAFAPLVGLPWFLIMIYLIKVNKNSFTHRSLNFSLIITAIIPLIFFSISSSKRILYILPLYAIIAILTAHLLTKIKEDKFNVINYIVIGFSSIIAISFIGTLLVNVDFNFPIIIGISGILLAVSIYFIYRTNTIEASSKPMIVSFSVSILLLINSSIFFSANELEVNSGKPITDFIISEKLDDREVMVYDVRKSSIAFGLNKSIISLNNGHNSLARETQFENDLHWKEYLINLKNKEEIQYLKEEVLKKPTVLIIYRNPLPTDLDWILGYYKFKKEMKSWTIYY